jgi:hypothetical protein
MRWLTPVPSSGRGQCESKEKNRRYKKESQTNSLIGDDDRGKRSAGGAGMEGNTGAGSNTPDAGAPTGAAPVSGPAGRMLLDSDHQGRPAEDGAGALLDLKQAFELAASVCYMRRYSRPWRMENFPTDLLVKALLAPSGCEAFLSSVIGTLLGREAGGENWEVALGDEVASKVKASFTSSPLEGGRRFSQLTPLQRVSQGGEGMGMGRFFQVQGGEGRCRSACMALDCSHQSGLVQADI